MITEVWEPDDQLELTTNDVKEDPIFKWFVDHIHIINDTTGILGIGKDLEQSMEVAEEVGERFYKLPSLYHFSKFLFSANELCAIIAHRQLRIASY